jgi:hypothetical protein
MPCSVHLLTDVQRQTYNSEVFEKVSSGNLLQVNSRLPKTAEKVAIKAKSYEL